MLNKLGVDISFSATTITWNNVTIDMKPPTCICEDAFHVEEELFVYNKTDRIAKILDAKYKPTDLKELTDNLDQLKNNQKEQLHALLDKQCEMFDGMLGLWKGSPYKIELRKGAKPHHARLYGKDHGCWYSITRESDLWKKCPFIGIKYPNPDKFPKPV